MRDQVADTRAECRLVWRIPQLAGVAGLTTQGALLDCEEAQQFRVWCVLPGPYRSVNIDSRFCFGGKVRNVR